MAEEFVITLRGSLTNGNHTESWGTNSARKFDQTAVGASSSVVTVGFAAEEDMAVGDISTEGYLYLKNLDDTNFVTYGPKDSTMVAFGRLEAGEEVWLRLEPGVTLRWQADTADVQVKAILFED